jgi:hypothetical protein
MKKLLLLLTAFTLSFMALQAQSRDEGFVFGGGLNIGLPTGNFGTGWSFGIGFQFQGEYKFSDNVSGVATTGYTNYFGKTVDFGGGFVGKTPNIGFIPFLVGARIYPTPTFFLGAQIGLGAFTNTGGSGNSGFDFRPQIGYNGAGYQLIMDYNVISVTAGSNADIGLTAIFKFGGGRY